jgi:serine/threonine-protein kinase
VISNMPQKAKPSPRSSQNPDADPVSAASLALLAALGALAAFWALFLWGELRVSRAGGTAFCGLGSSQDCAAVWDSAFAATLHRSSGLPVAAWGLVWGLVALALPIAALRWLAEERSRGPLVSAIRFNAAAGVVAVFVLAAVSFSERAFCTGCFVTYLVVAGYAGIALVAWRRAGLPEAARGLSLAGGATIGAYFLLLYPGMHTPRSGAEAGRRALERAGQPAASAGDAERDRVLGQFVSSLSAGERQTLADSLHQYRQAPGFPLSTPRSLFGEPAAPVRITEFTDILCSHCAELHLTLERLRKMAQPGSFSVEPRQFPLNAECNPLVQRRDAPVRCLAARAQICLEGRPGAFEFSGELFARQKTLTPEIVFERAAPHVPRAELEACLASPETEAKLRSDVETAQQHHLDGTPLVLVNGRKGSSFGPFLYAMVLTGGGPDHPAFDALPAANPNAHVH